MAASSNNWRGNDETPKAAKYRWQDSNAIDSGTTLPKSRSSWRLSIFTLGFLALFSWMLYIVLKTPTVTPVVFINATEYGQSLPPNAWVEEDIGVWMVFV